MLRVIAKSQFHKQAPFCVSSNTKLDCGFEVIYIWMKNALFIESK